MHEGSDRHGHASGRGRGRDEETRSHPTHRRTRPLPRRGSDAGSGGQYRGGGRPQEPHEASDGRDVRGAYDGHDARGAYDGHAARGAYDEHAARGPARGQRAIGAASTAGHGVVRGSRAVAKVTARASRGTVRVARKASEAQGAGETGLHRLIQVHAFSSAGDTAVMVGLAGTLFFQVPQGQAKSQVLMFLLLTMLPFAIVAPLIGPLLDRFRHGRRWSIGATLALRAFLCWVLASSITEQSTWQFPAALGVLVASKAYLVTRSSAAPRLLPGQLTLVKANGRLSLAGTVGAGLGGGLAGIAAQFGAGWALRVGFALFVAGTILAILLPPRVDSSQGEEQAALRDLATESTGGVRRGISGPLVTALRANSGLRWLSGFLTIYLAFLLREHPFPGWETKGSLLLGLVIGAAGVGNAIGTMTGALVRTSSPRRIILAVLLADAVVAVVAAVSFNVWTATLVALVAGIGQQMGKLALDALIQDTVADRIRTSVFARSETLLQLSWVLGGLVGVLLPATATIGMTTAAVLLVLWTIAVVVWHSGRQLPAPHRRPVDEAGAPSSVLSSRPRSRPRPRGRTARGRTTDGPAARPRRRGRRTDPPAPPPPADDTEETLAIRREDPWQRPPRSGSADADDRRDRWRSRFDPDG